MFLLFLPVVACAGRLDSSVRQRAAADFSCPADSLTIEKVEDRGFNAGLYSARGCDRNDQYSASCSLFGCRSHTPAEIAAQEAEEQARREGLAERRAAEAASANNSGANNGAGSGPAPKQFVSTRLHNLCKQKVLLFHGRHPRNSGGRSDQMSANSIMSVQGNEGDSLWIVDESGNGVSSFTYTSAVKELFITESCSGFSTVRA